MDEDLLEAAREARALAFALAQSVRLSPVPMEHYDEVVTQLRDILVAENADKRAHGEVFKVLPT